MAVLRRISRESVYTAGVVDDAARAMSVALASSSVDQVQLGPIEELDRPSLKVLIRAALLASEGPEIVWRFRRSVSVDARDECPRAGLMHVARAMLDPVESTTPGTDVSSHHGGAGGRISTAELARLLVMQDYERCLSSEVDGSQATALRLRAIACVNLGWHGKALAYLDEALACSGSPAEGAHLWYLRGLVEAKRRYNLAASDACHRRGLDEASRDVDAVLERAWLFNGLALNSVIRWRRGEDRRGWQRGFDLASRAFALVKAGTEASHAYLRFNLLANVAFLMEMRGRFDQAIGILEGVFEEQDGTGEVHRARLGQTIGYRIGMLQLRAGAVSTALGTLARALDPPGLPAQPWFMRERVLRAVGAAHANAGDWAAARDTFEEGMQLSLAGRSARGAQWHGAALAVALESAYGLPHAEAFRARMRDEEGLHIEDGASHAPPSPKLPAYIPEIDLEEIPKADLNRVLSADSDASRSPAWSS